MKEIVEAETRFFTDRRVVRFQEVDAAGLAFYARVFDYFHDAYVGFLRSRGTPLEAALRDRSWVAPLRSAEAEYLRPLRFGDPIAVSLVELRLEETEYTIGFRIEIASEAGGKPAGELACVGRTRHVTVDPATFRRCRVPDVLRRALSAAAGGGAS